MSTRFTGLGPRGLNQVTAVRLNLFQVTEQKEVALKLWIKGKRVNKLVFLSSVIQYTYLLESSK